MLRPASSGPDLAFRWPPFLAWLGRLRGPNPGEQGACGAVEPFAIQAHRWQGKSRCRIVVVWPGLGYLEVPNICRIGTEAAPPPPLPSLAHQAGRGCEGPGWKNTILLACCALCQNSNLDSYSDSFALASKWQGLHPPILYYF